MALSVNLYGLLRVLIGRQEMELPWQGGTLREMIAQMADQYGKVVRDELLDEKGELDRAYAVFIKGERVDDLSVRIEEGNEVVITSMLAGG